MDLRDKAAMVTGASKGIGRQTALDLAKAGADVAISARSKDLLDSLAAEIEKAGRKVLVFAGDMSKEEEIKAFIQQTVDTFGKINVLINNAGLGHFHPVAEMSTQHWDEMFNLNVRGLFITTREALPFLRQAGEAVIVNVVSLAGKNAFVNGGGYAASKHAVLGFSRCLMLEERKNNIRVLAICPGSVTTNFSDHQPGLLAPEKKALKPMDISETIIHAVRMPQRAMISEIDIRPSNP
ncbi:MAG: SDR family NAD(P)-dependent oxidoreductase [Candidatus Aminicenantes bacterium]|nr:SDR family NAD(P)-dependent oxidoreductase [Candidatus Aminicenantes bacterium]NIM84958.1 SDR family NAD(P)-dependent oxidoreductase [Candidatus Aminicenantes bacterium]NIN24472.1 SDR family NAD(P)-dependent oxidoreductase [Candidatus Aminicenantes bacterium]NIN48236.1 SDR family NAD(P)-dependent oxidoreductase [Candidatus Aminicenantes bacterium]NIN91139.1 SDR family NAD(P)-dependent oxidoreductase [Candidatus Aminicenantes bacterium]